MKEEFVLSPLSKTWILDFDGTLVEHNGYKTGELKNIPDDIKPTVIYRLLKQNGIL